MLDGLYYVKQIINTKYQLCRALNAEYNGITIYNRGGRKHYEKMRLLLIYVLFKP